MAIKNNDECICEFIGDTVGSAIWVKKCLTYQYQIYIIEQEYETKIKTLQEQIKLLERNISYSEENKWREFDKDLSNHEMGR